MRYHVTSDLLEGMTRGQTVSEADHPHLDFAHLAAAGHVQKAKPVKRAAKKAVTPNG